MRQSWDEFFYGLAGKIAERSTCLHRHYGCVLARDKTVISTGFNGAPRGCLHCEVIGCARATVASGERPDLCRGTHAEQNAIAEAARLGVSTLDTTLYLYPGDIPCPLCAKILINAGVTCIHYRTTNYPGHELSTRLFFEAKVTLVKDISVDNWGEEDEKPTEDTTEFRREDLLERDKFHLYP